jgi:AraC-like DNA-binding protein
MQMLLYDIDPRLQPFIKAISSMELFASDGISVFRVLPDTCVELFFNYKSGRLATVAGKTMFTGAGSFVTSRMCSFMDVQMLPDTGCIAICFYPGMAHYFFDMPMSELSDTTIGLDTLWRNDAAEIEDRIAGCDNNRQRVFLIQEYLLKRLSENEKPRNDFDYSLWQIGLQKGRLQIKDIARKTHISERQLNRQFHAFLGLSPKEYARMSRFLESLNALKKPGPDKLTAIAYESGYYDQAHFIRDCKAFAGLTPKEIARSVHLVF